MIIALSARLNYALMNQMEVIIGSFWFFLPAGIANMMPVLVTWSPLLDTPVDFGKHLYGQPIFGPNKTYRGFVIGIFFAIATIYVQQKLYPWPHGKTLVNYETVNVWWLGFLLGFGALGGDLVKSFIKRRFKIPSGWVWAPFDQVDWIIGAALLSQLVLSLQFKYLITAIIIFGLLHPIVNLIGYGIGVKVNKF